MSSRPEVSVNPTRAKIEHASHPVLQRMSRVPVAGLVVGFAVIVILGAVLGGVLGAALIVLCAAGVCWLAYLAWPMLRAPERMMRAAVIFLLLAVAVVAGLSHIVLF